MSAPLRLFLIFLCIAPSAWAQNSAPIGVQDLYIVEVNQPLTVSEDAGLLSNDYDLDGDSFSIVNGTLPDHGELAFSGASGGFTYTPDEDFEGTDTFGYRTRDTASNTSLLTTVTIEVLPSPNRAPVAVADAYTTPFETALTVSSTNGLLTNDYDPDGDAIFVGAFTSPAQGSVSINISTGSFTYTPDASFTGTDSFQYRIRDPDFAISELVEVFIGVGVDTVLPVELVRFEAVRDGDAVRLSWDTASETNNAGFDVERAINGAAFESLDFVEGHGTIDAPQSYTFTDTSIPVEGHNLKYRLKQIDYDGTFDYSPEVEVIVELNVPYRLTAPYPNPSSGNVHFSLAVGRAQQVEVALYDVLGRRMQVLFAGEIAAHTAKAFIVDTSGLANGQYMLQATGAAFVEAHSFVLAH